VAKPRERIKARELRRQGVSVKEIAKRLDVAKSTASLWVRDIVLTKEQLEKLYKRMLKGAEMGRALGALKQKQDRLKRIESSKKKGCKLLSKLSERQFFIAGLALYWAEGSKKQRRISFCNSDPEMIKFLILWLEKCFHISVERLSCYVGINQIHEKRKNKVKTYWSDKTGIPIAQFTKTSFKKVENKKTYANWENHYGTLTVTVRRPAEFYYDILGYIHGLSCSKIL